MSSHRSLCTSLVLVCNLMLSVTAAGQAHGHVTGLVRDINGQTVEGAKVEFFRDAKAFIVRTDKNGMYEIELVAGTYRVQVESTLHCTLPRASFVMLQNASPRFDFDLMRCFITDYTVSAPAEEPPPAPPKEPGHYQQEELNPIGPNELRPLVLYGEREQQNDQIHYSALTHDHKQLPVIYTYNLLTIKATALTCSESDNAVHGTGDVIWQDGTETRYGSSIDLTFRDGTPQVNLTD